MNYKLLIYFLLCLFAFNCISIKCYAAKTTEIGIDEMAEETENTALRIMAVLVLLGALYCVYRVIILGDLKSIAFLILAIIIWWGAPALIQKISTATLTF